MPHVFGPVPSRRLGRSLGVDLLPFKTCSYDCIYCELGKTTNKTCVPGEWVSVDQVLKEIREKLDTRPDYITIAGSGEPTLFSKLGELIGGIKAMTSTPVAVLTNGSLLWHENVRARLLKADVVMPSFVAATETVFKTIHRPESGLDFKTILKGLELFRKDYPGQYWLEVFLLDGINTDDRELHFMKEQIEKINPDKILINTLDRPPAYEEARLPDNDTLLRALSLFGPKAQVISKKYIPPELSAEKISESGILEILRRRPSSLEDLCTGLRKKAVEIAPLLEHLTLSGQVELLVKNNIPFYTMRKTHHEKA